MKVYGRESNSADPMLSRRTSVSAATTEVSVFKPANELSRIFAIPALVGSEKLEDYERFLASVVSAIKPTDVVGWLFIKDYVDWSWEIRRERIIKAETIKYYEKQVVAELIKSEFAPSGQFEAAYYRIFNAGADLDLWVTDPKCRKDVDEGLAAKGYDASYILAQAYLRGDHAIPAIDKRIAVHELRRNAALKEAGLWSDRLERQLDQVTSEVIDGEYTEAVN
jgi:hypothetical protein